VFRRVIAAPNAIDVINLTVLNKKSLTFSQSQMSERIQNLSDRVS
jgi:hypothetical protein